jgi:HK97 family phage major capsid protein
MATETTTTSARGWSPDVQAFAPSDVIPDALILVTSTVAGSVEGDSPSVRVTYVDDADAGFTAEGATIDEADPDLAEVVVYTGKISQLIRLSREQWGQPGSSQLLSESVRRAVVKAANRAYIAQAAPVGPAVNPPAGLLNIAGILNSFDSIYANLDPLADAITQIEENSGTASHIIASPHAWGYLRKLKVGTDRNDSLLGAGTLDLEKRLLGLPVLTTSAVPTGQLLVVDSTAIVSAVGPVMVAQSEHAYFASDSIALRCTWRFGANLVHPDRIARLEVGDLS